MMKREAGGVGTRSCFFTSYLDLTVDKALGSKAECCSTKETDFRYGSRETLSNRMKGSAIDRGKAEHNQGYLVKMKRDCLS